MPRDFAAEKRAVKAQAIADHIWDTMKLEQRIDPETLNVLRRCSQSARDLAARGAGQRSPSEKTWALVFGIIAERIKAARWGFNRGRAVA